MRNISVNTMKFYINFCIINASTPKNAAPVTYIDNCSLTTRHRIVQYTLCTCHMTLTHSGKTVNIQAHTFQFRMLNTIIQNVWKSVFPVVKVIILIKNNLTLANSIHERPNRPYWCTKKFNTYIH